MSRNNRRLELVRANTVDGENPVEDGNAFSDLGPVPAVAVLVFKQDKAAGILAGIAARVVEKAKGQ